MRNAGRHFFNINGNGTNQASRDRGPMDYAATIFAHNHLYNGMLQTRDAGFLSGSSTCGLSSIAARCRCQRTRCSWSCAPGARTAPSAGMELVLQPEAFPVAPLLNLRGFPDGHFECVESEGASAAVLKSIQGAVTYRTSVAAEAWTCEWRIPFAATGFTPRTVSQLRFNLAMRHVEDSWLYWSGTGGSIRQLALGGAVVFPAEFAQPVVVPKDGLAVWLDASDTASLTKDTDGRVAVWKDKSGSNRHARQVQPQHRPQYAAAGLYGQPSVQFHERAATRLELPDLADCPISATVFAVFSNPVSGDPLARFFTSTGIRACR